MGSACGQVVEAGTLGSSRVAIKKRTASPLFGRSEQCAWGATIDRFDALQAFVRVVEAGSFTKAAQTLPMSKATVTELVQQLEARLRVRLLNRTTRRVVLTADGAAYYERALRVLAELEDADTVLSAAAAEPRGRLRVDVPAPLAALILLPALPEFHARYPDIQLDLGVSDRAVDLSVEHVDCVLRGGAMTDLSLVARHVADLQIGVYAAPAYLARAGAPEHPAELNTDAHRTIGYRSSRHGRLITPTLLQADGESVTLRGRNVVTVDDGNASLAAGVAGLGALWVPRYMGDPLVARGELVGLFAGWTIEPMPLHLAYPPNRHVSAKLRAFIDWVVELLARQVPVP